MIDIRPVIEMDALLQMREEVLRCVFEVPDDYDFAPLREANRRYYADALKHDAHYAVAAYCDGNFAGCGGVCFQTELPSPDNPSGRCAYIMNIYTRPQWRHNGVAGAVVDALVDEARRRGADKIYLEPTACGRSLYLEKGFEPVDHLQLPVK